MERRKPREVARGETNAPFSLLFLSKQQYVSLQMPTRAFFFVEKKTEKTEKTNV